jgi:galactitol-specific phosphotransferase system IIB component
MVKVGINGFGCNGRLVFRAALQHHPAVEVVAINDVLEPEELAYQFQYDPVHCGFKGTVSVEGSTLIVNGRRIPLSSESDPENARWSAAGAEIIVDCSGLPFTEKLCAAHFKAGAKKAVRGPQAKDLTLASFSLSALLGINLLQSVPTDQVKEIWLACESGIGSSLMIVNLLKKKLKAARVEKVSVERVAIRELPPNVQVVLVHKNLSETVRAKAPNAAVLTYTYPMNDPVFDQLVESLVEHANITSTKFTALPAVKPPGTSGGFSLPSQEADQLLLVCESGIGSSLMIVNMLKKRLKAASLDHVKIDRAPIRDLPPHSQLVIAHKNLAGLVHAKAPQAAVLTYAHPLQDPAFDQLIKALSEREGSWHR